MCLPKKTPTLGLGCQALASQVGPRNGELPNTTFSLHQVGSGWTWGARCCSGGGGTLSVSPPRASTVQLCLGSAKPTVSPPDQC